MFFVRLLGYTISGNINAGGNILMWQTHNTPCTTASKSKQTPQYLEGEIKPWSIRIDDSIFSCECSFPAFHSKRCLRFSPENWSSLISYTGVHHLDSASHPFRYKWIHLKVLRNAGFPRLWVSGVLQKQWSFFEITTDSCSHPWLPKN